MQLFDPNNPNERKKAIAAAVLAIAAIAVLGYVFFGGSGSTSKPQANAATPKPTPRASGQQPPPPTDDLSVVKEVPEVIQAAYGGEPNRNIFAFYEPTPTPVPVVRIPTPTPPPPPPLTISSLMPSQVYARTADFKLQVMGDKFTPAVKIAIDGRELPTQFVSAQQITATVPASFISSPGSRAVTAQSNDGLYSNSYNINVTPPPVPSYTYIGLIAKLGANDIALLTEKGSKELLNVQRGDVLGGRFRVTSISQRELILTDITLKIKHPLPFTVDTSLTGPFNRPGPRNTDDEP